MVFFLFSRVWGPSQGLLQQVHNTIPNLVRIRIPAEGISCYLIILLYFGNLLLDDMILLMLRMNVLLCIFLFFLGLLYNLTESYDCAFYFAASLFLMGGAVMALPVLKFHKAPGPPIHATRSTSTIETQTFSDEDKFLTD